MKTICFACQKGGTAKTVTAFTVATALYNKGYQILCVDTDQQSNFSLSAGIDILNQNNTLFDVFKGDCTPQEAITHVKLGFDFITGGLLMAGADNVFSAETAKEFMLKDTLEEIQENFDFCIIDTSPHLGFGTINALTAANYLIIPVTADLYALQGLVSLKNIINGLKKRCNADLIVSGLLITRYRKQYKANQKLKSDIEKAAALFNTKVFHTTIREAVAVKNTLNNGTDLFTNSPKEKVTEDYSNFVSELLKELEV